MKLKISNSSDYGAFSGDDWVVFNKYHWLYNEINDSEFTSLTSEFYVNNIAIYRR